MSKEKRYRLLKEVLDNAGGHIIPIGEEFEKRYDANIYVSKNGWFMSKTAIENKDWFEEIKEQPQDEFLNYLVKQKEDYVKKQDFETASKWRFVERKYREYISYQQPTGNYISLDEIVKEFVAKESLSLKIITEDELNKAEEKAFNAARDTNSSWSLNMQMMKYYKFEDYKKQNP